MSTSKQGKPYWNEDPYYMKTIFTIGITLLLTLGLSAQEVKNVPIAQAGGNQLLSDTTQIFQELEVFPNPVQDKLTIHFQLTSPEPVTIQLFNLIGKQLQVLPIDPSQGFVEQLIDMGTYPSGIYILRLEASKETLVRRLSKR